MGESFIIVNLINEKLTYSGTTGLNNNTTNESNKLKSNDPFAASSHLKLRLKLFGGPSTGEVFYFKPESEVIKIGRST